ncbi:peptidylprolyl isomerase [Pseudotenacibaculum sp. MALMAid0570]|uniref:peptidylprolyl isomerase n=1 Tax=Pseudotenacibaculum sp. MALMAid0570 TaxID=3143938 RepID=UPI0032DF06C6
MRNFTVLILMLCVFAQCKSEDSKPKHQLPEVKTVESKPKKIIVEKKKEQEADSINNKNTVAFLKAYGKLNPETIVLFETRLGNIKIRLYKDTPLHRASFIFLTKTGYFSTTCFHRIVPGFIVQGGNSDHPITRKKRIKYNYRIPSEMKKYHKHKYGSLAAARQWDNNPKKLSSPFEFYMIQDKRGSHHLDGEHTIFGEIIEGISTMEKIAKLETDKKEWPVKDVFIKASVVK